jgi:hypothetical protein
MRSAHSSISSDPVKGGALRTSPLGGSPKFVCTILYKLHYRDEIRPLGSTRTPVAGHNIRAACMNIRPAGCCASGVGATRALLPRLRVTDRAHLSCAPSGDKVVRRARPVLSNTPIAVTCGLRREDGRDNVPCRRLSCAVKGVGSSNDRVTVATRRGNNSFRGCAAQRSVGTVLVTLGCETKRGS